MRGKGLMRRTCMPTQRYSKKESGAEGVIEVASSVDVNDLSEAVVASTCLKGAECFRDRLCLRIAP